MAQIWANSSSDLLFDARTGVKTVYLSLPPDLRREQACEDPSPDCTSCWERRPRPVFAEPEWVTITTATEPTTTSRPLQPFHWLTYCTWQMTKSPWTSAPSLKPDCPSPTRCQQHLKLGYILPSAMIQNKLITRKENKNLFWLFKVTFHHMAGSICH